MLQTLLHDFEHVGAVEDHFAARGEGVEQAAQDHGGVDVEAAEGLVEDEQFGIVQQGGEEEDFLAHAFGIGGERRVAVVPEADEAEEFVHLGLQGAAGNPAQASGELEIFAAGEVGVEVRLFGDVADAALEGFEIAVDVLAMEEDVAGGGLQESGEHFDGGAFSGAVGSEVAENFAGVDDEADAIHGGDAGVELGKLPGFQHGCWTPGRGR